MGAEELLAWALLGSWCLGMILVYWLVAGLVWFWGLFRPRESRYQRLKRRYGLS
jgi:hypothetical protein